MLDLTRIPKLYNRMALSGAKLSSIMVGDDHYGPPIYREHLGLTVAKTLSELTFYNIALSPLRAEHIVYFERWAKNVTKLTILDCNTRSPAYENFSNLEFFPHLKELHLDGVHLDPGILGSIIKSR